MDAEVLMMDTATDMPLPFGYGTFLSQRGWCVTLKRVVWFFEEGGMVL